MKNNKNFAIDLETGGLCSKTRLSPILPECESPQVSGKMIVIGSGRTFGQSAALKAALYACLSQSHTLAVARNAKLHKIGFRDIVSDMPILKKRIIEYQPMKKQEVSVKERFRRLSLEKIINQKQK